MDVPESTDDLRAAPPQQYVQTFQLPGEFKLQRGGVLHDVDCAYETWGELNSSATNAVLVCHAISGDSHAARHDPTDSPGWWDTLIGPGKAIDTDRFFVICPNVLGSCNGTTGPSSRRRVESGGEIAGLSATACGAASSSANSSSAASITGESTTDEPVDEHMLPWGAEFPDITILDMVRLERKLTESLGIKRLRAVVGGSLGGHQALTWATAFPGSTDLCIAIASSPRLTSQALGFDVIARNAIQTDPHFAGGQYYSRPNKPDTGLAIARMLGHITYLSSAAMESKFELDRHDPRHIASQFEQRFSIGSYLAHQGQKFTTRFDANSYITLSTAMDLFDLGGDAQNLQQSFSRCDCEFLIISFSSDWLFTPEQSLDIVEALTMLDKPVTYAEITTPAGHDAFLIERDISQYAPLVAAKLADHTSAATVALQPFKTDSGRESKLTVASEQIEQQLLDLIEPGTSVLDLGCGDGRLLEELSRRGHQRLVGVEVAQDGIHAAARRGLNVIDYDLNQGLPAFADSQFDFVVLSETLQIVANIQSLLMEMLRVGENVIVGFSNFAHRKLREDFVIRGRSPRSQGLYGHAWYNTPNRRFPSIADVSDLCTTCHAEIIGAVYLDTQAAEVIAPDNDPNLNADFAILKVRQL
ncbi:MAG TPA: homoserine O-acetyltransferase [Planctomycetaceae bacterium]|nr:homoserine O-acetyltransferase [Planctomycetaceae bacterium]